MKDIQKYKNTKTAIKVNTEEEYEALVPLLNTIFTGWSEGNFEGYLDGEEYFFN